MLKLLDILIKKISRVVVKKAIQNGREEAKKEIASIIHQIFKEEVIFLLFNLLLLFIPYCCVRYLNCETYIIYTVFALLLMSFFYFAGVFLGTAVSYWNNNGFTLNPYPVVSDMLYWKIAKRVDEGTKYMPDRVLRHFSGKGNREIRDDIYSDAEPYLKENFILLLGKTILLLLGYWAAVCFLITPFLAPAEQYNIFTAFFYPFWKSICFIFELIRATPWTFLLVFSGCFLGLFIMIIFINISDLTHKFLIALLPFFITGAFLCWFMIHNDYMYTGAVMIIYAYTIITISIKYISE